MYFRVREWYAYLDKSKKVWDFTRSVDLTPRKLNLDAANRVRLEDFGKKVERYWRHLPLRVQARMRTFGFVRFEDILLIDDKGDAENTDPHIFIDFGQHGPFAFVTGHLRHGHKVIYNPERSGFKRKPLFPDSYPEPAKGTMHDLAVLGLPEPLPARLQHLSGDMTLYAFDGKMNGVAEGDLIKIPPPQLDGIETYAEVTHISSATVSAFLKEHGGADTTYWKHQLKEAAGKKIKRTDRVKVLEIFSVMLPFKGDLLVYLDRDRY